MYTVNGDVMLIFIPIVKNECLILINDFDEAKSRTVTIRRQGAYEHSFCRNGVASGNA